MLRARGRKRGPYSAYEFKDATQKMPKSTSHAVLNPPPPKKRRKNGNGVTSTDDVPSSPAVNPGVSCSERVQDIIVPVNLSDDGALDQQPQDLPLDLPFHQPQDVPAGLDASDQDATRSVCLTDQPQVSYSNLPFNHPQDLPQVQQWEFVHGDANEACDNSCNHEDASEACDNSFNEDEEWSFSEQQDAQESTTSDFLSQPEDPDDSSEDESLATAPEFQLTSVSAKIKVLLLLAAKKRHKLTYAATECILRLAGVWSKDLSFAPSKHVLKSAISLYSSSVVEHHICPHCNLYVGQVFDESAECRNCFTEINSKLNKKQGNVFLYYSISEQIKSLLTHSGLYDELIKPQHRHKIQKGNYEDIMDGTYYKARVGPDCISFNFFVDGYQVRSTSKNSAWPVLVCLNELPLHLRRKHLVMASVWLGKEKPIMNEYLKPFVRECIELERNGISLKINGVDKTIKVIPLMCVSDSIARPALRNATQFNGNYGCGLCYHPAFGMRRGRGRCKSYSIFEREFPSRTHEETMQHARNAEALGTRQQGIKGVSILSEIPGFDIVNCVDLDIFHALVNCAKRFTNLWLSSKYSGRPFNVNGRFAEIDRRLLSITPNDNVSRNPRSLSGRSDYRGHEWFTWVVFYSIPVLTNILPNNYLSHWALLVHGIVLLMQNSVSKADVVYAGRYLRQFNSEIDRLYGAEHVTFSTHLLTHLEKSTHNFSQPWTHSAFVFESFLGELKSCVHGSCGILHQIAKHMQLRIALRNMKNDLDYAMNDEEREFLESVTSSSKLLADPTVVVGGVSFLGEGKSTVLSPNLHQVMVREGFQLVLGREYLMFDRCIFNDEIFQSVNYERVEKQNNAIVMLKTDEVFEIHSFIIIDNVAVALGHYLVKNQTRLCNVILPHMRIFNEKCEENLRCVRVLNFDSKLLSFCMSISDEQSLRISCINVLKMEMLH